MLLMPFRIYMHKQWAFKICTRITSAFSMIAASSVLRLASTGGSDQYFGCLVQNRDLHKCIHWKPLLWRSCFSKWLRGSLSHGNKETVLL